MAETNGDGAATDASTDQPAAASSAAPGVGGATGDPADRDDSSGDARAPQFDCENLENLNADVFPDADEMWEALRFMVEDIGPRHAGSEGGRAYTDYIEQRMRDMGLEDIVRKDTAVLGPNGLSGQGQPSSGTATHIHGVLPGMNANEVVIFGVHQDGPNSVEENGVPMLLELMEYFSRIPRECRQKTYVLAFPICHMAMCAEADVGAWARDNPDLIAKTVAVLAPEHAGHKRYPQNGGTVIEQAFRCTTAGISAKCDELLTEVRRMQSADTEWLLQQTILGSSAAFLSATRKPVVGSMSYWDTLQNGLTDTNVVMDGIDKEAFYLTTWLYGRLAGWIDGQPADAL